MSFRENVRWGVSKGLKFAVFYTVFLVVPLIARAIAPEGQRPVSFPLVVLGYFGGAVVGGALIGAMRPLARWPGGSILIGMVAGPFIMAAVAPAVFGSPDSWGAAAAFSIIVPGVLLGAILGGDQGVRFVERDQGVRFVECRHELQPNDARSRRAAALRPQRRRQHPSSTRVSAVQRA